MDLEALKEESKRQGATITQYLTAVLIYSIYQENYLKAKGKRPVKVCIPVNLKKYFPSKTMSNFFSYITVEAEMKKDSLDTFEKRFYQKIDTRRDNKNHVYQCEDRK